MVKHIKKLEKVPRYATILVPEIRCKRSESKKLMLTTLEDKREREDMIIIYEKLRGNNWEEGDRLRGY